MAYWEQTLGSNRVVTKILNGKQLKLDNAVVAFSLHGSLVWSNAGLAAYDDATRQMIQGYADD